MPNAGGARSRSATQSAPPGRPAGRFRRGSGGVSAALTLRLEEEGHRSRDGRRLAIRAAVLTSGDVAEVVLEDADTADGRRQADDAHRVDVVGGDRPDLLAELDLLLLGHPERLPEVVVQLLELRE